MKAVFLLFCFAISVVICAGSRGIARHMLTRAVIPCQVKDFRKCTDRGQCYTYADATSVVDGIAEKWIHYCECDECWHGDSCELYTAKYGCPEVPAPKKSA